MEHDRWVAERKDDGWRIGPRDPEKKLSPYLVDWNDLEEDIRDYDRHAVLGIPATLAQVGLRYTGPIRSDAGVKYPKEGEMECPLRRCEFHYSI